MAFNVCTFTFDQKAVLFYPLSEWQDFARAFQTQLEDLGSGAKFRDIFRFCCICCFHAHLQSVWVSFLTVSMLY